VPRSNIGRMPFLPPPITHTGTSWSWTQVNQWTTAPAVRDLNTKQDLHAIVHRKRRIPLFYDINFKMEKNYTSKISKRYYRFTLQKKEYGQWSIITGRNNMMDTFDSTLVTFSDNCAQYRTNAATNSNIIILSKSKHQVY